MPYRISHDFQMVRATCACLNQTGSGCSHHLEVMRNTIRHRSGNWTKGVGWRRPRSRADAPPKRPPGKPSTWFRSCLTQTGSKGTLTVCWALLHAHKRAAGMSFGCRAHGAQALVLAPRPQPPEHSHKGGCDVDCHDSTHVCASLQHVPHDVWPPGARTRNTARNSEELHNACIFCSCCSCSVAAL